MSHAAIKIGTGIEPMPAFKIAAILLDA